MSDDMMKDSQKLGRRDEKMIIDQFPENRKQPAQEVLCTSIIFLQQRPKTRDEFANCTHPFTKYPLPKS
ncbi:MAG: hypothetical protein EOO01_28410 [Chitinophagaceae bacterium]|nr:MAG: hypothetical protein EOO01_28410 [Chitinophagaceae bacterium]